MEKSKLQEQYELLADQLIVETSINILVEKCASGDTYYKQNREALIRSLEQADRISELLEHNKRRQD